MAMNDFIVGQMAHERQADLDRETARVALAAQARRSSRESRAQVPPGSHGTGVRSSWPALAHRLTLAWRRLHHRPHMHTGHAPR